MIKKKSILIALCAFGAAGAETGGPARQPIVDAILSHYGYAALPQAKEIAFTFHAKKFGMGPSHAWIYRPQSDSVTSVDKGISYSRKAIGKDVRSIDKDFVNDWYWFSFPMHLGMDKDIRIAADSAPSVSPVRKDSLLRVEVTYMQKTGYTPNDRYELWVARDGTIEEWKYHRHGGKYGMAWTWEKPETHGGMTFATDHQGMFHIYFTDVAVR